MNCELKYEAALKQLQEIVERLESGQMDIDALGKEIKKAQKMNSKASRMVLRVANPMAPARKVANLMANPKVKRKPRR